MSFTLCRLAAHAVLALVLALVLTLGLARAAELNPAAVTFKLPDQINWKTPFGVSPGVENAVLVGDPTQPGLYVVMVKWLAGNHFSHPHFHPHDRYITVLKGTWWVGTGSKYDPDATLCDAGGHFRDPLRRPNPFRRRQGRRRGAAHRRRGTGDGDAC
jgi:hypothetical protein